MLEISMEYQLTYRGQWLSLNQVYQKNRYLATQVKNEWKQRFQNMFAQAEIKPFQTFKISMRYNSRMDCENTVAGLKIAVDTLRSMGLVANDDKRYYKGVEVIPDPTLAHNQYDITIHVLS